MKAKGVLTPTLTASLKSSELINLKTSFLVDSPLVHTYVPLRKSMYNEVWDEFELEIKSFLSNKFRTYNDLNLATFLSLGLVILKVWHQLKETSAITLT
ncbi:stealth conserved region 3 domain-containing protein [Pantoea rodasii]|uniref:stealth conserved region 3 domain-containing protein n=1 Tax=Pantoea rodasii TaxID=1076549 RepID=UPI0034549CB7